MSIKSKFDGFGGKDLTAEVEKQAKEQLRREGLNRVRVTVVNIAGKPTIQLDGEDPEELAKAAKALGIEQ